MNQESQKFLLNLARQTLEYFFRTQKILKISETELTEVELKEKRGTFVTLMKDGQLCGCIGHIEPVQEIYKDVISNVLSAAFEDTRFEPLVVDELEQIKIEISVLTKPQILIYSSIQDLLNKLIPLKHGVIIRKGRFSATYLPQVWEEIEAKEEFLSSLCLKAGLDEEEWKRGELEVSTYEAEVFFEN